MTNSLLKIVNNSLIVTRDNIIGMKGKFPFSEERNDDGNLLLYSGKIVDIIDENMYKILFDDGDVEKFSFEDAKQYILKNNTYNTFKIDTNDKNNMGRVQGNINVKTIKCKEYCTCNHISRDIFLEDNKNVHTFKKDKEIIYNFKDIPYISHLKIIFGNQIKNVKVSILKIMDKKTKLLENIDIININNDSNIYCDCNVKWIKINIQSLTDIKNIKVFFNNIKNTIKKDYDNIYNTSNPIMIPSENYRFL